MKHSEEEVFSRFMRSASERWGENESEEMKPAFKVMAEAISIVDGFGLAFEDEPTQNIEMSKLATGNKATGV